MKSLTVVIIGMGTLGFTCKLLLNCLPLELHADVTVKTKLLGWKESLLVVGGVESDYNRWRDLSDTEVRLGLFYAGKVDN